MNVPLAIFEESVSTTTCKLYVSDIGANAYVIFGGMFF